MKLKFYIVIFLSIYLFSCNENKTNKKSTDNKLSGNLIIFHAGSFSFPIKLLKEEFEKRNTGVTILSESAGSVASIRKITDLNKDCDILISADYYTIDDMMIPNYADFNIKFATNEIVIAYNDKSKYSNKINSDNWIDLLLKKDVIFGRSDPDADPCGYRTVLMWKLAEKFYNNPNIEQQFIKKNTEFIRPKEVDLIPLIETNAIDYLFQYKSVAIQHKLKYISLSEDINLASEYKAELYKTVSIKIRGTKKGEKITITGMPMVYGATIVNKSINQKAAIAFLEFMLSDEGKKIIEKSGQKTVVTSQSNTYEKIPNVLKKFATK